MWTVMRRSAIIPEPLKGRCHAFKHIVTNVSAAVYFVQRMSSDISQTCCAFLAESFERLHLTPFLQIPNQDSMQMFMCFEEEE